MQIHWAPRRDVSEHHNYHIYECIFITSPMDIWRDARHAVRLLLFQPVRIFPFPVLKGQDVEVLHNTVADFNGL